MTSDDDDELCIVPMCSQRGVYSVVVGGAHKEVMYYESSSRCVVDSEGLIILLRGVTYEGKRQR
jgi:hypothetical protein